MINSSKGWAQTKSGGERVCMQSVEIAGCQHGTIQWARLYRAQPEETRKANTKKDIFARAQQCRGESQDNLVHHLVQIVKE